MIVFNIYALLQAILLFILGLILEFTGFNDYTDNLGLTTDAVHILYFYGMYMILAATDRAGVKGQLFWIPTWILALIVVFLFNMKGDYGDDFWGKAFKTLNYFLPILLGYRMTHKLDAIFRKKFEQGQIVLNNMDKSDETYEASKKTFWAQISHTFAQPSNLYLFTYPVYSFLHRNTVPKQEFIAHNLEVIETIRPRLSRPESTFNLGLFHQKLKAGKESGSYTHEVNSMSKLAKVIDAEYKVWKDT